MQTRITFDYAERDFTNTIPDSVVEEIIVCTNSQKEGKLHIPTIETEETLIQVMPYIIMGRVAVLPHGCINN